MAEKHRRGELIERLASELRGLGLDAALLHESAATKLGVNATDLRCALLVRDAGPLTAGRLAELSGLTTGAITGVVDRLERAELIERAADPEDRRRVVLRPLDKRTKELDEAIGTSASELATALGGTSEAELGGLLDAARRTRATFAEARARARGPGPGAAPGKDGKEPVTAPRGNLKRAALTFPHGVAHMRLSAAALGPDLFRARFEGPWPVVKAERGAVVVTYRRATLAEAARWMLSGSREYGHITLAEGLPWAVEIRGGVHRVAVDLTTARVADVELSGGVHDVELVLPPPEGTVAVRVAGGAHKLVIRRPRGSAARIQVAGGASKLRFDSQTFGAIGGEVSLESPDFPGADDRYEIRVSGGASSVTCDQR